MPRRPSIVVSPRVIAGSSSTARIRAPLMAESSDRSPALIDASACSSRGWDSTRGWGGPSKASRSTRSCSETDTPSTAVRDGLENLSAISPAMREPCAKPKRAVTSTRLCAARSAAAFNSAERLFSRSAIAASSSVSIFLNAAPRFLSQASTTAAAMFSPCDARDARTSTLHIFASSRSISSMSTGRRKNRSTRIPSSRCRAVSAWPIERQ